MASTAGAQTRSVETELVGISQDQLVRLRMALGRLGRTLRQQSSEDLPYALISLLLAIHRTQPVTAKALAASEGVTPPAVTRSLQRLQALGLIVREPVLTDRRVQAIELSELGERTRVEILHEREIWLTEHLARLTTKDLSILMRALPALERLTDLSS